MSQLVNIPKVNQNQLMDSYRFAAVTQENLLVLGPSGTGKTDMAFQICQALNKNCVYVNMSVMERPDLQGIPVISTDKKTASFAPNEFMPFEGIGMIRDARLLDDIIQHTENIKEFETVRVAAEKKLLEIRKAQAVQAINNCSYLFTEKQLGSFKNESLESNNILFLDEIDKTPPENLQPLLELLLYHKINGRKLDIHTVLMTGNLPDENAYSEPLSHALTNRAMILELQPDINVWLKWAKQTNLHPIILGFLTQEDNSTEFFHKKPKHNQLYSYAYPTPRSWTDVSGIIKNFESYKNSKMNSEEKNNFQKMLIASKVGEEAAAKLDVWLVHYRKYTPLIEAVFNGKNEEHPSDSIALIVCCIALANKFTGFAKQKTTDETSEVQKKAKHIFQWIDKAPMDVKTCAVRSSFDLDVFTMHQLDSFKPTASIWRKIVEILNDTQ